MHLRRILLKLHETAIAGMSPNRLIRARDTTAWRGTKGPVSGTHMILFPLVHLVDGATGAQARDLANPGAVRGKCLADSAGRVGRQRDHGGNVPDGMPP